MSIMRNTNYVSCEQGRKVISNMFEDCQQADKGITNGINSLIQTYNGNNDEDDKFSHLDVDILGFDPNSLFQSCGTTYGQSQIFG